MTGFLTGITEVALHVVGWGIMLYVVYIAFTDRKSTRLNSSH